MARYSLFVLKVPLNTKQTWQVVKMNAEMQQYENPGASVVITGSHC